MSELSIGKEDYEQMLPTYNDHDFQIQTLEMFT